MRVPSKPVSLSVPDDKALLAVFKNSMRAWQARYKARLAAQAVVFSTPRKQTSPT